MKTGEIWKLKHIAPSEGIWFDEEGNQSDDEGNYWMVEVLIDAIFEDSQYGDMVYFTDVNGEKPIDAYNACPVSLFLKMYTKVYN